MNNFISKFKKNIDILISVASVTYKEWAAYRTHSMVSIFTGPVYFIVQISIWKAVYSGNNQINGLNLQEMITYFGIATLINYLIMDFAGWNLQMLIHTGKYVTFMLRPISHIYFAFSQKVGHRILGFTFEFLPVYFIFLFIFKIKIIPSNFFWATLSLLMGFMIMFLINYLLGSLAFWIVKTDGIRTFFTIVKNICSGAFFPLIFFPDYIQNFLFYLPFQFMVYVPIRVFIGSYKLGDIKLSIPNIVGFQAIALLITFILTLTVVKLGRKKFSGVGV
jgi:ABC-2 type transport system permease protein